jgi:pimeloyl-ACP methyl ester carboxylesterase
MTTTAAWLCKYAYFCESMTPADFGRSYGLSTSWDTVSAPLSDWKLIGNDVTDAEAICCRDELASVTYVAFRGTESIKDVLADVWIVKSRLPGIIETSGLPPAIASRARVHSGFLYQFGSIAREMCDYISQAPENAVVLTGHSLGGALATLASLYVQVKYPGAKTKTCVFGSPRVGNSSFSDLMACLPSQVERHVHGNDPVARLPHRLRWKHCGTSVVYDAPKGAAEGPADTVIRGLLNFPSPFRVRSHSIDVYLSAVASSPFCLV